MCQDVGKSYCTVIRVRDQLIADEVFGADSFGKKLEIGKSSNETGYPSV